MYLYLVEVTCESTGECFNKIGVTENGVKERFSYGQKKVLDSNSLNLREKLEKINKGEKYISDMPYDVKKIHVVKYKYSGDALIAEKEILLALKKHKIVPKKEFSGKSECFVCKKEKLNKIIEVMNKHSESKNEDAPSEILYKLNSMKIKHAIDEIDKHKQIIKLCKKTISL